jgi:hypothetical protein
MLFLMDRKNKDLTALRIIDVAAITVHRVLPWLLAIVLLMLVRSTVSSITGQDTLTGAWLEFTSHIRVSRGFAFVFGGFGILYGLQQRNLRRAEERRLFQRLAELENRLESNANEAFKK